jgi:hypothetical protein
VIGIQQRKHLAHIVLDELAARDGKVDRPREADTQHALHRDPSNVETAERGGQPLGVFDSSRNHADLAINQLGGWDLIDVGDAVTVVVTRVILLVRIDHLARVLVDELELTTCRRPASHVERLGSRNGCAV